MIKMFKEIVEELLSVLKGKTLDTLVPPIVFVIFFNIFNLNVALLIAFLISLLLGLYRILKKETSRYALLGLFGVVIASAFAYVNKNATNYFLPDIITNAFVFLAALVSLLLGKPLAAFASHLTRGWPIEWFWRHDVKPAYIEVTWFWMILFLARTIIEVYLYSIDRFTELVWINTIIGFPLMIVVLTISYIYGIWRLKKLRGPGIDEFIDQKEPPYKGQNRGF